jgi:large subunit ribosomal protein L35Ae
MKGIVIQFRRGRKTVKERHFLLDIGMNDRVSAEKIVGKEVSWKSPAGKIIKGKIAGAHGNKGLVRAIFEKGLPGQAITTEIEVLGNPEKEGKKENASKKEAKK